MRAERTLQPEEHCYINASLSHRIFAFRIILKLTNISLNKIYVQKKSSFLLESKGRFETYGTNLVYRAQISIIHKEIAQILNEYNDSGTSWKWTIPYMESRTVNILIEDHF